jgi:hypothetical protein
MIERGHLCMQLLGLDTSDDPRFRESVLERYCEGATFPLFPGIPAPPIVTAKMWLKATEERICTHQNWRRKVLIYEKGID